MLFASSAICREKKWPGRCGGERIINRDTQRSVPRDSPCVKRIFFAQGPILRHPGSEHALYPTTSFEHEEIIPYLGIRNRDLGSNRQFDAKNHYYVTLFGPGTHICDEEYKQRVQIARHKYEGIEKIMAEQKLLPFPN